MKDNSAVIIMAKQPRAGKTKTRLCPPFTPETAALFFEAMLRDSIALAAGIHGVQLAIAVSPPGAEGYFETIVPPGTLLLPIEGENIGVCLRKALEELLARKFEKVIALNGDGPSLPGAYLAHAFTLLEAHDLVFGPGEDGGYYLVGLKTMQAQVFESIPWSTDQVLEASLAQARKSGVSAALTQPWYDIDTPADARRLRDELAPLPGERLVYTRQFFDQHPLDL